MSLNILFINSINIYGGGEVWMINTGKELIKRNHNLMIACRPGSQLKDHALKNNIKVLTQKIGGDINPFTIIRLVRIIYKNKIDIILTNTDKELRLCGIASKISGRAKVIARHGIDYPLKNKLRYRITYNKLADLIISNSLATKKTLLKNAPWLNSDRIKVIYNGINPDLYNPERTKNLRKELNIPDKNPLIGFVGRLSVQKGIKYLLDAFLKVRDKLNAHLLIAGTGEIEQDIKDFILNNKLSGSVHLLGFREDVNNIMRTIDLLVLPSIWEGFGIVLIEAMASGKPCITTQISSMPEIVKDSVSGIIVPPKDSDSLARACLSILSDNKLAVQMGIEGRRIVNERFTLSSMADKYEEVFLSLLN
jgi:glycosyltransferase involved in cell wall biosynthesis